MKKLYLIHGWGGSSEGGWFDLLKKRLSEKGVEVISFDLPNTDYPEIEAWVEEVNKKVSVEDETYLLGHSMGCQTIMRFLERQDKKVAGSIFVAGFFEIKGDSFENDEEREVARPWKDDPIDFEKVRANCKKFLAIFSTDDPFVDLSQEDLFKQRLNAETIVEENKGHFDSVDEFEEAYKEIEKFILD